MRPLKSPQRRDRIVGLRLNATEHEALETFAWRYEMDASSVIRDCLQILSVIPDNPVQS